MWDEENLSGADLYLLPGNVTGEINGYLWTHFSFNDIFTNQLA